MAKSKPQPKPKTQKEIEQEISKLEEMKPFVRQYSMFGGDNHAKIEVELQALRDMDDEMDADDEWPEEEDNELHSAATYAIRWKLGEEKDSLSESWSCLDSRNKSKKKAK